MRKSVIYLILYTFLVVWASGAIASPELAKDFVQNVGNKVINIVTKELSDSDKEKQLDEFFTATVDINWIAKFVVGRYWRESTTEQQEKYIEFYSKFLLNSYVPKFRQYTDQKMVIDKFIMEADKEYLVDTTINEQDGKSYKVSYRIRQEEAGSFKIYDIIAEGVSMITTQRSEFGSILSREGMDSLITKLQQKK